MFSSEVFTKQSWPQNIIKLFYVTIQSGLKIKFAIKIVLKIIVNSNVNIINWLAIVPLPIAKHSRLMHFVSFHLHVAVIEYT